MPLAFYLRNREQGISLCNYFLSPLPVLSGVSQTTSLGPIGFIYTQTILKITLGMTVI